MDCSRIGDQHHTEFDGANTEISDSRTFVGTGGKNEKTKDPSPPGPEMISCRNDSGANSKLEARNSKQAPMFKIQMFQTNINSFKF